ncbi:MAG: hypothetical protein KF795_18030 [Labilithrix sp.]|nr:hypothetical protein [Labilithrix sp.]
MRIVARVSLVATLALSILACARQPQKADSAQQRAPAVDVAGGETSPVAPQANAPNVSKTASPLAGSGGPARAALAVDDRTFGAPTVLGNLAIYPVTSRSQVDVGPLVSLDDALAKGEAEIRENNGGGTVNQLVIDNKGSVPIFVLAGTVVKGGNQDRQIGQDFIIESKKTTPVDAFCVEHGRWNGQRNGQVTAGKFDSSGVVATSKVRAAGQYKKSQSEVWSNVSSTNAAHQKRSSSDTLMATLDDAAVVKERSALVAQIDGVLATVTPQTDLVGVAYAIDGEVRGARWFSHHKVFELARKKVVASIALDAITARAEAKTAGRPPSTAPAPPASSVDTFVKNVEAQAIKEQRDTPAANVNEYKESADGFGSKTMMKGARPSAKPVSNDYLKK